MDAKSPRRSRWLRDVGISLALFASIILGFYLIDLYFDSIQRSALLFAEKRAIKVVGPAPWWVRVLAVLAGTGFIYFFLFVLPPVSSSIAVEQKEKEIAEVQQEISEKDLTVLELLDRAIRLAINREEASMLRAEGRADMLFRIGLFFMIASVLAPLLSAFVYWSIEPLSAATVENLKNLRTSLGSLPAGMTIPVQRDWRVLLGGISFGFLFLAAAAGLMKQQGRQTDIYFRTGERVKFFERLASVVGLHAAAARKPSDGLHRELVTLVTEKLIAVEPISAADSQADPAESGPVSGSPASEILRAFHSIR